MLELDSKVLRALLDEIEVLTIRLGAAMHELLAGDGDEARSAELLRAAESLAREVADRANGLAANLSESAGH